MVYHATGIDVEHVDTTGSETIIIAYDDEGRELTGIIDWRHLTAHVEVDEEPF